LRGKLTQYNGIVELRMPTAIPAINRPAMSMPTVTAPPCRAHPKIASKDPINTAFFLPNGSDRKETTADPRSAPPFYVSFGIFYDYNINTNLYKMTLYHQFPNLKCVQNKI